jgi:hypothetical protein
VRKAGQGRAIFLKTATLSYLQDRLMHKGGPVHTFVGDLLRSNGLHPEFAVTYSSDLQIGAPTEAKRGTSLHLSMDFPQTPAALHIVHVDAINPEGQRVLHYSGNVLAEGGHVAKLLPWAENDASGVWTLHVHDLLSGRQKDIKVNVN